jgi:hypothetical protein
MVTSSEGGAIKMWDLHVSILTQTLAYSVMSVAAECAYGTSERISAATSFPEDGIGRSSLNV